MSRKIEATPVPAKYRGLAGDLRRLRKPTDSFVIENKGLKRAVLYSTASRLGVPIITQAEHGGGLRVWRRFEDEHEPFNNQPTVAAIKNVVGPVPSQKNILETLQMKIDAIEGGATSADLGDSGIPRTEDDWRFTSDRPQYESPDDVYRKQFLGKKTRTVKVDADDLDTILEIK